MRLESPYFLLLLIPLAGLFMLALRRKSPCVIIPSLRPVIGGSDTKARKSFKHLIPLLLETLSIFLMIIALARPQQGIEELKRRAEGIDIIIALDLSGSMRAIDVPDSYRNPESLRKALEFGVLKERIDVAKEEIKKFIERRPNDRIGLVAFAPLPYLAAPPTLDHSWTLKHLEKLNPGDIGDATGIAGPIASATARLKDSQAKRKIIVLFTDGKNNVEARVTPLQAAKIANDNKITIHTVGIGSENSLIIVDGLFGRQIQQMRYEFDEKLLREIAESTGGRYFAAKDAEGLEKTMIEIDKLEKTSIEEPIFMDYRELGFPILGTALIILLSSILMSNTVLLKIP
ncbi:MAG TPA: VWA domain-containing protein [Victivallales bacterium]|nr:VWA domain-containing protein [Victivallales bacterium]